MTKHLTIGANQIDPNTDVGQQALEQVHGLKAPVLCRCTSAGVPMYVARLEERYIVKRMPGTGIDHAPDCSAFEPPEHLSGLSELQGSAISEEPEDGSVLLKLDFPLSKTGKRAAPPPPSGGQATEAISNPRKMGLTGLLHYLWQEGELTKWSPELEGQRKWRSVRSALLNGAYGKKVKGFNLSAALLVPEAFYATYKDEIAARHKAKLVSICSRSETSKSVGIMIAEYKDHEPTRLGARFSFRHAPDITFFADADLLKRFEKVFEAKLALLDMIPDAKAITIVSFAMSRGGYPVLEQVGMMLVDKNWLPFEHMQEAELLKVAVAQKRRFAKQLRYNLPASAVISSIVLNDSVPACALFVVPPAAGAEEVGQFKTLVEETEFPTWLWSAETPMPELPAKGGSA